MKYLFILHACVCESMHVLACMFVCVCLCVWEHACICVYVYMYACARACMHACVCTSALVFVGQKTTYRTRFSPSTMLATRIGFRQTSFMASTFTCCTNYFSIAVIKHHDQEQLKEEFILSFGSRGRLYNGRGGVAWWWKCEVERSHLICLQEAEQRSREWVEGLNSQSLPPVMFFIQQGCTC